MTFTDARYAGQRKRTRKALFLIKMDQVVLWKGLIERHCSTSKDKGRRPTRW